ncbi:auxin-responsive protein IAA4-like [Carex rostrata]
MARVEMENDTELRLGLPGSDDVKKRSSPDSRSVEDDNHDKPSSKVQLVGWPPVRSYMKNNFYLMKNRDDMAGRYVKVSMDGAPYLRKVDLKNYKGYKELREALENLFGCFSLGEQLRMDGKYTLDYTIAYEDKDLDLMLLGDVPWENFLSSCKKLRIMTNASGNKDTMNSN